MNEIAVLDNKIESLRDDVNNQLSGARADIKDLTKALRELIRLDGELKNVMDTISRLGHEVDDHEDRIRVLEKSNTTTTTKIGTSERFMWLVGSVALSAIVGVVVARLS